MQITAEMLDARITRPEDVERVKHDIRALNNAVDKAASAVMARGPIRKMYPCGLPAENPFPQTFTEREWSIALDYINDPHATLVSVALGYGITRERVRQIIAYVHRECRSTGAVAVKGRG